MKCLHVIPHIGEEASGPSYSVPRLCQGLAALGHEIELKCLGTTKRELGSVAVNLYPQWPVLPRFAISPSLASAVSQRALSVDIVHNHSLWSMINVATGFVVPGKRAKLVTSPRGTLSPWALSRSKALKDVLWPLQRRALTKADLLHATSEIEFEEIRAKGLNAPVAVIPNGIDLPLMAPEPRGPLRTLLFLSRIHPKKGIDHLLTAWIELQDRHPQWRLEIVGTGEPHHVRDIHRIAADLRLTRVDFPGPKYGAEKSRTYFDADLFVLPTHSENFGLAVAEALAHGCPAVVTRGAPWAGLPLQGCGWWVDHSVSNLTSVLDAAMSLPRSELVEMGRRGRAWMERDYSWESVAEQMESAYRWILGTDTIPSFVRVD